MSLLKIKYKSVSVLSPFSLPTVNYVLHCDKTAIMAPEFWKILIEGTTVFPKRSSLIYFEKYHTCSFCHNLEVDM